MSSERRLHPYSVLFAFIAQIRIFIVPGILVYFGFGSRDNEWWQPWMMVLVVPSAAIAVVRYLTYRFRYEASELVIQSGLVFRKERHVPYARIQNIDAVQNVLHRLLDVVEIRLETGGGRSAEATMSVLPITALTEMRSRVFAERHAVAVGDARTPEADRPLLRLDLRELLLCGFIENRGAVLMAAGFGLFIELGLFNRVVVPLLGQPVTARGLIRSLGRSVVSNATLSWRYVVLTVVAIIGLLLLIRVLSMVWAVIRLHGFTLSLIDDDARTQFGLLTRVAMTIPLRRVQALTIRESPLHRLFARVAIKVDTAGGRHDEQQQGNEREYLAPILRAEAVDDFVRAIVGVSTAGLQWTPPHARAFRREVKGWLVLAAIVCIALALYARWYAAPVMPLVVGWTVLCAHQTIRNLGWTTTDEAILFKRGWLWRRIVIVRYAKIQTVTQHATPFDRRTIMARVHVDTAGASPGSVVNIPYLAAADATALYERLSREAAGRQFKW